MIENTGPKYRTQSTEGEALTKSEEGLRLEAYKCIAGVWTIGWGHTGPDVHKGLEITETRANTLYHSDIMSAESAVNRLCPVTTQAQFDALVDFAVNLGEGALEGSTLRKLHNESLIDEASKQFSKWVYARVGGGRKRKVKGLILRRERERLMYLGKKEWRDVRAG